MGQIRGCLRFVGVAVYCPPEVCRGPARRDLGSGTTWGGGKYVGFTRKRVLFKAGITVTYCFRPRAGGVREKIHPGSRRPPAFFPVPCSLRFPRAGGTHPTRSLRDPRVFPDPGTGVCSPPSSPGPETRRQGAFVEGEGLPLKLKLSLRLRGQLLPLLLLLLQWCDDDRLVYDHSPGHGPCSLTGVGTPFGQMCGPTCSKTLVQCVPRRPRHPGPVSRSPSVTGPTVGRLRDRTADSCSELQSDSE